MCLNYSFLLLVFLVSSNTLTFRATEAIDEIKIGVLLRHRGLEEPLNRTIEMLNADNSVLPNTKLRPIIELIDTDNSYQASNIVCKLLVQQVWAIIGPQSIQLTPIVQSISSHYHIPLLLINWQPHSYYLDNSTTRQAMRKRHILNEAEGVPDSLNYTINLYPMADQLSRAYLDMIRYKEWKSFSLIYDSPENFLLVKDILETSFSDTSINIQEINLPIEYPDIASPSANSSLVDSSQVTRIEYCNFENDNINLSYRKLMKDLRRKGVENLVLSMSLDKICKVLKEARNVGLLTIYSDYILVNLDAHLLNLTQLHPLMTNISGYSLLDPEGQPTEFMPSRSWLGRRPSEVSKKLLSTEYSMMSDAVALVARSLDELISDPEVGQALSGPGQIECQVRTANEPWQYGDHLMDVFKRSTHYGGYTGDIKFDRFGQRVDFNLDYILYKNNTFKKAGTWNLSSKLDDMLSKHEFDYGFQAIKNKTLIVSVAITSPYVMRRENESDLSGNERYEGYCIDLLNKLAAKLQFKYVIKEVADGRYGNHQNGTWNGMIRELLDWKADLAIVDLTINKDRQSAVDFTHPFMTLGIAIMYKKPKLEEAELYSFLMPFSKEVWLSMWSAYVGVSLTIWMISRLSPLEWRNPHPCFENSDERDLENEIHSIGASLWFTIGSLMQQGSDLAPRSLSVRAAASVWYFFTLILISSYTANFAAFLTASRMQSPIESAEDLSKQTKIDYGCKEGGSTQAFFMSSNHSTYRRMWNFMESRKHQGVFPTDNKKGVSMVKKGNFAFLMESTTIEYMAQRDCELTQIGGLLDHKGYGIALRKRSPFRAPLSRSINKLNEDGDLQELKNKWWNTEIKCDEEKDSALATSELGIDKVGGVFVLLGLGVGIACCMAILEFAWKSLKTSKDQRVSSMVP